jgi:hypothetical protein
VRHVVMRHLLQCPSLDLFPPRQSLFVSAREKVRRCHCTQRFTVITATRFFLSPFLLLHVEFLQSLRDLLALGVFVQPAIVKRGVSNLFTISVRLNIVSLSRSEMDWELGTNAMTQLPKYELDRPRGGTSAWY